MFWALGNGSLVRYELDKLVLCEYLDGGDLFGLLQFTAGIIPYYQVVEFAANAAQ